MTDSLARRLANNDASIGVIGLGYVGLPLAVEFGKHRPVVGFDINTQRIEALKRGEDATLEVSAEELAEARQESARLRVEVAVLRRDNEQLRAQYQAVCMRGGCSLREAPFVPSASQEVTAP